MSRLAAHTWSRAKIRKDADPANIGKVLNTLIPATQFKLSTQYRLPGALNQVKPGGHAGRLEKSMLLNERIFDVAPPAAPPEPQTEIPPGPEQVEKENPRFPERPEIEPPEIQMPSHNPIALPIPQPVPDPGPPVKDTTAPESRPAPPARQVSDAKPTWEGAVLAALNKKKRYPREASFRRQQGVPWIRFVLDREGKLLSSTLERSSGFRALDEEALSLPKRAQPLPKPPDEVKGDTIELVVPVEFFLR